MFFSAVFWGPFSHMFFYFLRTIQYFLTKICTYSWYTLMVIFLEKYCVSCPSLLGPLLGILGSVLVYPLFLENQLIFYHETVYRCAWYYCDSCYTEKTFFTSLSSLMGAIWGYF